MARIRTIKPTFFRDHGMAELRLSARLTFIGLWTYVDDEGRGIDDARLVKGDLWSLDDAMTVRKVEADLALLAERGHIVRYRVDGRRYLAVKQWKHQKVSHPTPSSLPSPPDQQQEPSRITPERSRQEGNKEREEGREQSAPAERVSTHDLLRPDAPPSILAELDQVIAVLCAEHGATKVEAAVNRTLDEGLRFPFPSKVRSHLEQVIGPRDERGRCPDCGGVAAGTGLAHFLDCPQHSSNARESA